MTEPVIASKMPFVRKLEPGTYWWCSCGKSKDQPFCDGSHNEDGVFSPKELIVTEEMAKRPMALCNCKHSAESPLCDGAHSNLG